MVDVRPVRVTMLPLGICTTIAPSVDGVARRFNPEGALTHASKTGAGSAVDVVRVDVCAMFGSLVATW
jgi:hypothetical protein